ncbi:GTP pyrophosphokinase family protein [Pokkaliibacter sp. CJK22405]|uniref:GTP pyrophosphokinase n=1 Tax=Pokkaliibacter sp. CJK22405 TaxID=3384615 RepID=UPI003984D496
MNEKEFRERWVSEKPIYAAWGDYIVTTICEKLRQKGLDPDVVLKIPPKFRLKDDNSLIDKAFYRTEKNYSDPYLDIEDKVGARFVVLLLDEVDLICDIIEGVDVWRKDRCRHFNEERQANPLLFTYQSVHYILRPNSDVEHNNILISTDIPCELQIRTLLQHAHAELTHDAIYKANRKIEPEVHRTVAKSMALIETTDGFFLEATKKINYGPLEEYSIVDRLNGLYESYTGMRPNFQKSSLVIWEDYKRFIDGDLIDKINDFLSKNSVLVDIIKTRYRFNSIYEQSVVLFIYWMLHKKRRRLVQDWPLSRDILEFLANDLGVALDP